MEQLTNQFIDIAIDVLTKREPKLSMLSKHLPKHLNHENSDVMSLGSVLVTLGIIDQNQTTTAGTIQILNECLQYSNSKGVSG